MTQQLPVASLVGFLLALIRLTSWMAISPPFNNKLIPRLVKVGIAAGISLVLAPHLPANDATLDPGTLAGLAILQVATGLALGYLTLLLFSAVQAAGNLIDLFGGFTLTTAFDPYLNNQSSVFGRLYQMLATTLLFVMNGHLLLVKGFMTSFDAVPLGGIHINQFRQVLLKDVSMFMIAAVEIAGPLLAAFFLAEIALGLLSKAAPQLNILTFGLPFKVLLTVLMLASALPLVPGAVNTLVNDVLRDGVAALHASTPA